MARTLTTATTSPPPGLLDRALSAFFHYLRLIVGCIFIVIGILGVILPVLPGTIWLILASLIIAFNSLGLASLIKMVIFIAFLLVGLAYAWKKGALTWE